MARAAKGIEEEVEAGVRVPVGTGFAGRIARERVAIFIADVDHADIMNPILREQGIRSLLGVPLIIDGNLIGVLHVGSLRPRVFDLRDLAILDLAAARAAPAIERGRLLSALAQEHNNALLLQRSLLPNQLVSLPSVAIAARYIPARDEVGGDWYWLRGHGIDREVATEIIVAVNEACSNAIAHAYGPGRGTFTVRLERVDGWIEATVIDRGRWRAQRDENRGRGLKIMRAAMDQVDVKTDRDGTEVVMRRAAHP